MKSMLTYNPIGLTIPLVSGTNGYFQQSFDTRTQVKQNLLNFLNTRQGERRMSPTFGTKLHTLLLSQHDSNLLNIMKNMITNEINQWVPEIDILDITIINNENVVTDDNYKVHIVIDYATKQTNWSDSVTVQLSTVKL